MPVLRPQRVAAAAAVLALVALAAAQARGQGAGQRPIFNRFAGAPREPASRMRLFEVPVYLRPQTNADADIVHNLGLSYVEGFFPRNRVFVSFGYNYAQQEWEPASGEVEKVRVKQFDLTQHLNFWVERALFLNLGLGLGLMDGLLEFEDDDFQHRLEPYIPIQLGLGVPLGDLVVSLRVVHSPFLGSGPLISHTRGQLGLGYMF